MNTEKINKLSEESRKNWWEDNFRNHKVENMSLWSRSVQEILKKQDVKMYYGNRKNFHIFNFSPWNFCSLVEDVKDAQKRFFHQKGEKIEGSKMLRYGVISDWNMIFLNEVIEKIEYFSKMSIIDGDLS